MCLLSILFHLIIFFLYFLFELVGCTYVLAYDREITVYDDLAICVRCLKVIQQNEF